MRTFRHCFPAPDAVKGGLAALAPSGDGSLPDSMDEPGAIALLHDERLHLRADRRDSGLGGMVSSSSSAL